MIFKGIASGDRLVGDHFGYSVAMKTNRVAIGAPYRDKIDPGRDTTHQTGAIYVFDRSGATWTETGKLVAEDAGFDDRLGLRVALDGSYVVASTPYEDHDADSSDYEVSAGAAYVFYNGATGWSQQKKLVASDRDMSDYFGCSVDIDGFRGPKAQILHRRLVPALGDDARPGQKLGVDERAVK